MGRLADKESRKSPLDAVRTEGEAMAPQFSIITTCKGRRGDLKLSLPTFLAQDGAEMLVVDYDCPDGTSAYVPRRHPPARLVAISDRPKFNASHARNLGAAHARGECLVFLDADVLLAEPFLAHLQGVMEKGSLGVFDHGAKDSLRGSCVVDRRLFQKVGGYDEVIEGYGGEDLDLLRPARPGGHRRNRAGHHQAGGIPRR